MSTVEEIKKEMKNLLEKEMYLFDLADNIKDGVKFGAKYQAWYSRAIKIVETLAPDRLQEFLSYYLIDPKRQVIDSGNYVIQDYFKATIIQRDDDGNPLWDHNAVIQVGIINQMQILASLSSRIDSVLQDITGHLFVELQDKELETSSQLLKINPRAAGALAGVVLERHLQRTATNRQIKLEKEAPTISDLNDSLKKQGVYGKTVWSKIQFLAQLRNKCCHQKESEPTKDEVSELIDGVNSIIKSVKAKK